MLSHKRRKATSALVRAGAASCGCSIVMLLDEYRYIVLTFPVTADGNLHIRIRILRCDALGVLYRSGNGCADTGLSRAFVRSSIQVTAGTRARFNIRIRRGKVPSGAI